MSGISRTPPPPSPPSPAVSIPSLGEATHTHTQFRTEGLPRLRGRRRRVAEQLVCRTLSSQTCCLRLCAHRVGLRDLAEYVAIDADSDMLCDWTPAVRTRNEPTGQPRTRRSLESAGRRVRRKGPPPPPARSSSVCLDVTRDVTSEDVLRIVSQLSRHLLRHEDEATDA